MSHPQPQLRALLNDGPHSGQTISIEPDADGQAPAQIVVHAECNGEQVRQRPAGHDDTEQAATNDAAVTYQLTGTDDDLGLWVYRVAAN